MSFRFFHKVFKKEFPKLKFHHPRTDTCATCDLLVHKIKATVEPAKLGFIAKPELYHRKAEKAKQLLYNDCSQSRTPASKVCTVSVDMQ